MEMCGKVAGRWRTIPGSSLEEMDVPIKVDEELYFEGKFDTEAMLNMLEKKVLEPAGVDYSSIKIRYMGKGQEAAKSLEQDVLEQEGRNSMHRCRQCKNGRNQDSKSMTGLEFFLCSFSKCKN